MIENYKIKRAYTTQEKLKIAYEQYCRTEKKNASDFQALKKVVNVPTSTIDDFNPILTKISEELSELYSYLVHYSGISFLEMDRALKQPTGITYRVIGHAPESATHGNRTISLSLFRALADVLEESPTKLLFHKCVMPVTLPKKHALWIRQTEGMSREEQAALADFLGVSLIGKEKVSTEASDVDRLISARLQELAEGKSVIPQEMGPKTTWFLNATKKLFLDASKIRFRSVCLIAAALNCSLDYLLLQDYSQYQGRFVDDCGLAVNITAEQRRILGMLLTIQEQEAAEWIGWLLASASLSPSVSQIQN